MGFFSSKKKVEERDTGYDEEQMRKDNIKAKYGSKKKSYEDEILDNDDEKRNNADDNKWV